MGKGIAEIELVAPFFRGERGNVCVCVCVCVCEVD